MLVVMELTELQENLPHKSHFLKRGLNFELLLCFMPQHLTLLSDGGPQ